MTNNELKTNKHYLAYLDILGTRKIIEKDRNDKYLNLLNKIYKEAIETKSILNTWNNMHIMAKIFSDNILLFVRVEESNSNKQLRALIGLAGTIQCIALEKGYLIRGSIAQGNFCSNNLFVHGKALIDAVELEEDIAIYPRIIIQENIDYQDYNIIEDNDGIRYINSYCSMIGISLFKKSKQALLKMLMRYKDNTKIKQKIMWSIKYHNIFCAKDENKGRFLGNPIITDEDIANIIRSGDK